MPDDLQPDDQAPPSKQLIRRRKGYVQNVANQLAQIAVGYQIMFDGPPLLQEPDSGVIEIDVVNGTGTVNGRPTDLSMAKYLHRWMHEELIRLKASENWLEHATVVVQYDRASVSADPKVPDEADLQAEAHVISAFSEASSISRNRQQLLKKL